MYFVYITNVHIARSERYCKQARSKNHNLKEEAEELAMLLDVGSVEFVESSSIFLLFLFLGCSLSEISDSSACNSEDPSN